MIGDIIKTGFFLMVTCFIAAICLAFTETVTAPRIKEFREKKIQAAKQKVLSDARRFEELEVPTPGSNASRAVTIGLNEKGETVGYVLLNSPKGYGGPIFMVVGITKDFEISGVEIQSQKETPGLGTKLKDDFLVNFLALCKKMGSQIKIKLKKDGGDVDGITAATISSRAFCKGVRESLEFVREKQQVLTEELAKKPSQIPGDSRHDIPKTPDITGSGSIDVPKVPEIGSKSLNMTPQLDIPGKELLPPMGNPAPQDFPKGGNP